MKYNKGDLIEITKYTPGVFGLNGLAIIKKKNETASMGGLYTLYCLKDNRETAQFAFYIDDDSYVKKLV
jgi:hypothetical protein